MEIFIFFFLIFYFIKKKEKSLIHKFKYYIYFNIFQYITINLEN